jgi:hypothetical protein
MGRGELRRDGGSLEVMKIDRVADDNMTQQSVLRLIECNAEYAQRAYSYSWLSYRF